jgi:2-methylcitrate dehydratase
MAGFVNGVMVRYLDCNDSYFSPGGGHPSDMIPAVLAMAGPMASDGREVITAVALAYEVFCRLSDEVVASDHGWDQGIFSVIGAVCGAGKVMGLDQQRMGHAISLAVAPHLPLGVTRTGELAMWKGCAAASATRSAIFAAMLAAEGMTGPFEPFEGRRGLWEQAVGRPVEVPSFPIGGGRGEDDPFRVTRTIFKSYPSQIHTQGPIGLAVGLHDKVAVADIESIHIDAYKVAASTASSEPEKWDPQTRETADHSIPYVVAVAFSDGAVTPSSFTPDRVRDPALRPLMQRINLKEAQELTQQFPEAQASRMEVVTKSGERFVEQVSHPKGHRQNPLTDGELEDKFCSLAGAVLTLDQCRRALDMLWDLERVEDIGPVLDLLQV